MVAVMVMNTVITDPGKNRGIATKLLPQHAAVTIRIRMRFTHLNIMRTGPAPGQWSKRRYSAREVTVLNRPWPAAGQVLLLLLFRLFAGH